MNKEFLNVVEQLEREKGLDKGVLIEAVKYALEVAARKIAKINQPDFEGDVRVEIDESKGDICVYVGDEEMVSKEFGRIAAQTARQVIIQKIREAEKENVYNEFKGKEGDIVGGLVYRLEKRAIILDLMGKAEGIIPHSFMSPLDKFRMGERVRAFIYEVKKEKGTQIILSRKHENLVKKLFELEVPEIYEGIVEVKSISREAGERTKIAMFSKDDKVDCVGACVGIRGSRVKSVIDELRGEKIDIVRWHDDIKEFIKAALAPAVIWRIELDRESKRARVLLPNDQLSLAIGKKGQNVRLASKLVGWEIDVRSREAMEEEIKEIALLKSVGKKVATVVVEAGFGGVAALARTDVGKLSELKGIGKKKAAQIIDEAKKAIKKVVKKENKKEEKKKKKRKKKMRIHELAKILNMDSKELLVKLKKLNFPVKSHMSSIDEETAEVIKQELSALNEKEIADNVIEVDFPISIKDLSIRLNMKPSELLTDLMRKGKLYTINHSLDEKTACSIAYGYKVNLSAKPSQEETILKTESKNLKPRAPIVTFMGHIDHGKTSLLDHIRKSTITAKETGGITQHIGAYLVNHHKGEITFLDTPGHETFTAMRARGANITDIVVLVVAADEGVKPQTIEALDHAKAAKVPIIVAINKIDRPNADIDMVKQELSKAGLAPEDWGGETITAPVSAKTGKGMDDLLDLILLQAEILELKADYDRAAVGMVVEARLSKGKGPLITALVTGGKLNVGDWCVCGLYCGKIRAMHNDHGQVVKEALPSHPAEILGLGGVPNPGDQLFVVPNEKAAKEIATKRKEEEARKKLIAPTHLKLEDLYQKMQEGALKQLKVILKADVGGTLEAVEGALQKIPSQEVALVVAHKGVGAINSSDILLADVTDAIVVGFKSGMDSKARELSKAKGIEVRTYQIVYELIDDIRAALEGLLTPQIKRTFLGRAKVKTVFKLSKSGIIAGCMIDKGKIVRGAVCHVFRGNEVVFEGKIQSLKRFKEDVREVGQGYECGISVGLDSIAPDDVIDVFNEEMVAQRLKS
ncbi:MAG: translation initiation factor IF-2 [Candidatus Omnitrophica bacterium]|nr:translation initiation factor IF-2 [Candidatus Omnitrophota bacterium]